MPDADKRDAFYQAIMDDWEDDAPRLVYADWLDERGDEVSSTRAELIRAQCTLARCQREEAQPPEGTAERVRQLTGEVCEYYLHRGLIPDDTYGGYGFDRGFGDAWGDYAGWEVFSNGTAEDWTSLGPIQVNSFKIETVSECARITSSPGLKYWMGYSNLAAFSIEEAHCIALFGATSLANLRRITITDQARDDEPERCVPIGTRGLKAIADNPTLSKLTHLRLWWAGVGDDGLKALAESKHLRRLRKLSLADEFTDAGIAALARSPVLESVEYLHLNGRLTGRSLKHLMASPRLKSLHTLDLSVWTSGTHEHDGLDRLDWSLVFDKVGVEAFVSSPLLPQLKVLKLSDCGITSGNAKKLVKAAPRLTSLVRLSVVPISGDLEVLKAACRESRGRNLTIAEDYSDQEAW